MNTKSQAHLGEGGQCYSSGCVNQATHELHTEQVYPSGNFDVVTAYCLDHAKHFAWWLVYAYTNEVKILNIRPLTRPGKDGRL